MITSSSRSYFAVHSFNAHYGDWLTHIKRKPNCVVVESCLYDDWEDGITPPYIPSVVKPSSQINERTHSDSYPKKYCDCLIPKFIHKRLFAIARAGIAEIKDVSASLASCLRINHKTVEGGLDRGSSQPRMQHALFMALLTYLTIFKPHALGGFPGTLNGEVV